MYFQYDASIYEQKDGEAMGSLVSAVIADLCKPKIWKQYVDDTFTILDQNNVDGFLQHLNNQQPTIRFTMKTKNDNTILLLDTSVITTDGFTLPVYTGELLVVTNTYDSHHPQSVKHGIVKSLYDRARYLITKLSTAAKEKKHFSLVCF